MDRLLGVAGGALLIWLLWNLLVAGLVGAVARWLLPGKEKIGILMTIVIGFLGGILANVVGKLAGWVPPGKNVGIIGSLIGAFVLVVAHRVWTMAKDRKNAAPKPGA